MREWHTSFPPSLLVFAPGASEAAPLSSFAELDPTAAIADAVVAEAADTTPTADAASNSWVSPPRMDAMTFTFGGVRYLYGGHSVGPDAGSLGDLWRLQVSHRPANAAAAATASAAAPTLDISWQLLDLCIAGKTSGSMLTDGSFGACQAPKMQRHSFARVDGMQQLLDFQAEIASGQVPMLRSSATVTISPAPPPQQAQQQFGFLFGGFVYASEWQDPLQIPLADLWYIPPGWAPTVETSPAWTCQGPSNKNYVGAGQQTWPYVPEEKAWHRPWPSARYDHAAWIDGRGRLLIFGGVGWSDSGYTGKCHHLRDMWAFTLGPIIRERGPHRRGIGEFVPLVESPPFQSFASATTVPSPQPSAAVRGSAAALFSCPPLALESLSPMASAALMRDDICYNGVGDNAMRELTTLSNRRRNHTADSNAGGFQCPVVGQSNCGGGGRQPCDPLATVVTGGPGRGAAELWLLPPWLPSPGADGDNDGAAMVVKLEAVDGAVENPKQPQVYSNAGLLENPEHSKANYFLQPQLPCIANASAAAMPVLPHGGSGERGAQWGVAGGLVVSDVDGELWLWRSLIK